MSLRYEQYRALSMSRDFLRSILRLESDNNQITSLKERARDCLRHFPVMHEDGRPIFSRDEFLSPSEQEEQRQG